MPGNAAVVGARVSGCIGEGTTDRAWADCGDQRSDDGLQRPAVIDLHMQNRQPWPPVIGANLQVDPPHLERGL